MARPRLKCMVTNPPMIDGFEPFGMPERVLEPVSLLCEEYEAMRLADYEGLTQEQAAVQMQVSRPTFTRIYDKARKAIARALVEGRALVVEGGHYYTDNYWYRCQDCKELNVSDQASGECVVCGSGNLSLLNSKEAGQEVRVCICVHCNQEQHNHHDGVPCRETHCPNCGRTMLRKGSFHHQLYLKKQKENEKDSSTN